MKQVEKLWLVDTVPFRSEKVVTHTKQDAEAISILETKTIRVEVDGMQRYATPQHQGHNLNDYLLLGPTLGATLLGVLPRFREHAVAVSGDIRGMFHQVRLLPEDRALLRLVWRDVSKGEPPAVYEWQVLPFGTTCSPCCATFALQRHVIDNS